MRAVNVDVRVVRLALVTALAMMIGAGALEAQDTTARAGADSARLPRTGALRGVVAGQDGSPLGGVDVVVMTTALRVRSRADGSFQVNGMPPGDYEVVFRRLGFDPASFILRVVSGQQQEVQVKLAKLPQKLDTVNVTTTVFNEVSGVVTDTSGRSLAGVDVEIDGTDHRMRTRADGGFLFLDIPAGRYMLRVRKLGYAQVRRSIEMAKQLERRMGIQLTPLAQLLAANEIIAQSGLSAADSVAQAEFSIRRRMAGSQSDLLVKEDIAELQKTPLNWAIRQKARGIAAKELASSACVLIDGQTPLVDAGTGVQLGLAGRRGPSFGGGGGNSNPASRASPGGGSNFTVLQTMFADQVESVELFPAGSEHSQTACSRFPINMPQCGCDAARPVPIVVVWLRK